MVRETRRIVVWATVLFVAVVLLGLMFLWRTGELAEWQAAQAWVECVEAAEGGDASLAACDQAWGTRQMPDGQMTIETRQELIRCARHGGRFDSPCGGR